MKALSQKNMCLWNVGPRNVDLWKIHLRNSRMRNTCLSKRYQMEHVSGKLQHVFEEQLYEEYQTEEKIAEEWVSEKHVFEEHQTGIFV